MDFAPRTEAMEELLRLRDREEQANARVDEVIQRAREATAELEAAREALVELERRAGDGNVTSAQRQRAEKRLALAEERAGERWAERRAGAERAVRDCHHAVQLHAAEHLAALVAEIEERGRDAAEHVNDAAQRFLDAVQSRAAVDRELTSIVALTRQMKPSDIGRAKSDQAAQEVAALLQRGGEAAPVLRVDLPVAVA